MEKAFFDGWQVLVRTLVVGVLAYAGLVVFLRVAGKRTLSKLNAFDLVVTVALGSTLASILLNRDVSLAQGLLAFALLIGLQFAITWTSVRWKWIRSAATGEPALLAFDGQLDRAVMRQVRITEDEVEAALRSAGLWSVREARAVLLETDGSISVVRSRHDGARQAAVDGDALPQRARVTSETG